jgi:hypothetical protein
LTTHIKQIPLDVYYHLKALDYLINVPVVWMGDVDADKTLDLYVSGSKRQNNKTGAAVAVLLAELRDMNANLPTPRGNILVRVRVWANSVINNGGFGTGLSIYELTDYIARACHSFHTSGRVITVKEITPILAESFPADEGYEIVLTTAESLDTLAKTAMPSVTIGEATVTITTSTSGASIYYTLDDTFPAAGNTAATLYAAAFAKPSTGTTIRAAAYKTNLNGSDVTEATVT